jgi:hypothetical protein
MPSFLLETAMAMMLRQKGTGDIYIYTELLSRRDDMEVFESEPAPSPVTTSPQPAKLSAVAKPLPQKAIGDNP